MPDLDNPRVELSIYRLQRSEEDLSAAELLFKEKNLIIVKYPRG